MPVRVTPKPTPARDGTVGRIGYRLVSTALIVVALGVLPSAWHASFVWQVSGGLACVAVVAHTARTVWRDVFSTDPRHVGCG